jgi:hypothetical protein
MAGMPKRREKRESAARQALAEKSINLPAIPDDPNTKFNQETAEEIVCLIADGVPIDNTMVGAGVAVMGIASRLRISSRTIYRWQKNNPEFAELIGKAREESAHRYADRITSLADVALDQPHMANAVRVAGELLRWSAMVRNRAYYGEKSEASLKHNGAPLISINLSPLPAEKIIEPETA